VEISFNRSRRGSLGVELELSIVSVDDGRLASVATDLLAELGRPHPDGEHPKAKHELFESTVEIITGVCTTVAEARADLAATIAELRPVLAERGLDLVGAGTHPVSHWRELELSPGERYRRLVDQIQWPARRLAIFGTHFHVGVETGQRAVSIVNSLAYHLPCFLVLSASSPFWHGDETGMASARTKVFEGLPTAGLPPHIETWGEFEQLMETLIRAGAIDTIREVWWDVRPHPDFGTVELRMCDAVPTLREVASIAALAQSLVVHLDERLDAGERLPVAREWVIRQNKWLAARHGLDAQLIVDDHGRSAPARDMIADLVATLMPTARALCCADELADVQTMLDRGLSYQRQRRIVADGGTLRDVVDSLRRELAEDRPRW
jgi:glutamate---cysteine ligase / carboxylate-amine ligase